MSDSQKLKETRCEGDGFASDERWRHSRVDENNQRDQTILGHGQRHHCEKDLVPDNIQKKEIGSFLIH